MTNIYSTLQKKAICFLILYSLSFNLILTLLFALIRNKFGYAIHANFLSFDSFIEEVIVVLLIAPLLETGLYQYAIVNLSLAATKAVFKREIVVIALIISAVFFSYSHFPDYFYMIYMFFTGISYSLIYFLLQQRSQRAFIYTMMLHTITNLCVLGLKYF